jgi:hypothetical protein
MKINMEKRGLCKIIRHLTFYQSATRLNQIINNNNMTSSRVSLLDTHNSLVTFPNFSTNDLHIGEQKLCRQLNAH